MPKPFINRLIFLISLLVNVLSNSLITLSNNNNNITSHLLVLGLRHSRANLLTPKTMSQTNTGSIIVPLRAVRDGFLMPLYIGTPPQAIQVYMDTGSDLTWVPCGNNLSFDCLDCDDYRNNKLTSSFSPSRSSTSLRDLCRSSHCTDIHGSDNYMDTCTMAGCSLSTLVRSSCYRPCPSFAYTYGAGGVVTGFLTRDTLRVHENIVVSPDLMKEIPNFSFGCVGSTYREPIGIAGFGRGTLSLPSQLEFLKKGFSHCFLPFKFANNPNISSPLVAGDIPVSSEHEEDLRFTPILKSRVFPSYYYIGLEGITVGSSNAVALELPSSLREFDLQGNGGMLIDSGTTYTHLPEPIYSRLLSTLDSMIAFPRDEEIESRTGFDLCYKIPYGSSTTSEGPDLLPPITFHFLSNVSIVLSGGSHFYVMEKPRNSTVVKCLLIQTMEDADYGPAGVFGSFQQQNVKVVYDLEKERIGFQQMDCSSSAVLHGLYKKP